MLVDPVEPARVGFSVSGTRVYYRLIVAAPRQTATFGKTDLTASQGEDSEGRKTKYFEPVKLKINPTTVPEMMPRIGWR